MLTLSDIRALVCDFSNTNVLSAYVETRVTDPAMRDAWRPALATALRDLGASVPQHEQAEFERARSHLEELIPRLGTTPGAEGWVAFVTAAGTRQAADLPTRCPTLAAWRDGPVVAPYMRVLKEHRPVVVALVESRTARLYRYAWGSLEELPDMNVSGDEHPAPGEVPGPGRSGKGFPAPRSATGTERAQRRQRAAFERLSSALAARLAELAGDDAWILLGGTRDAARLAGEALPTRLAGRVSVSDALDHDATATDIIEASQQTATALRAAQGQALLDSLFEGAGAHRPVANGVPAVQRALRAQAVDLLLVSPAFVNGEPKEAEDAIRTALVYGAEVEVLSGHAAERLDQMAGGVGARLRFAVA